MLKNVASQKVGVQMVSATDGSAFTGSVTVAVTGDAGTQATGSVGSGACTHEGNGYHTYAPAQAETNYDLIAFTFTGSGAVPATVQVYTRPTTGLLAPATAGRTLVVDASGLADANAVKVGPSGSGTAQTARDLGASVLLSPGTGPGQLNISSGVADANVTNVNGSAADLGTAQTGDAYATAVLILALLDDARGEPGQGNPPVNPDLATKIDYLYKAWRNRKTQTASEFALYADNGSTKDQEAAISDDGTTTVFGEMQTGA